MPGVAVSSRKQWSNFAFSSEREELLRKFLLPREKYKRYGYRTEKYSAEELLYKHEARCKRCHAFALKPEDSVTYRERLQCRIHPGQKLQQVWSCCRLTTVDYPGQPSGCRVFSRHDWTSDSVLPQGFWDLHHTPPFQPSRRSKQPRKAVSLDCEMATNRFDQPELIKLTLVDIFTQEVLIDAIVKPLTKIKNMTTHIHGITYKDIISAAKASTALLGRDAAREKVFEFVGPETMVLVHGGRSDLICLRWVHTAVVDTQEVESRVKRIGDDELDSWLDDEGTGLEAVCRLRTGIQIRSEATRYGNGVHDSLEDAMACRELGIWYAENLIGDIRVIGVEEENEQDQTDLYTKETVSTAEEDSRYSTTSPNVLPTSPLFAKGGTSVSPAIPAPKSSTVFTGLEIPSISVKSIPPLKADPPEFKPKFDPPSLGKGSEQFWDCKVCNMKVPKAAEPLHRSDRTHMTTLLRLIQQKGG